ncbi:MAG: PAS domain S-box protein [Deltaproteobacteria bacterium]|nr:PAS domain S-box protein [Deltaproteobacteria bacterium]
MNDTESNLEEPQRSKILVVEGELPMAADLAAGLQSLGYKVCGNVATAEEALDLIEKDRPELVLMDIILTGKMDGIEAAKHIRSRWDIPIVFIMAWTDQGRLEQAKVTYPFGHILKPPNERDLKITIDMSLYVGTVDAERKKAEKALKASEEKFRLLCQASPIGVYLTDEKGACIFVNNAWGEMAGLAGEEALGQGWLKGIHPDDRKLVNDSWYNMVESKGKWGLEYRFVDRQGKITWVYGLATEFLDENGKIIGYLGTNTDITARKLAAEEVRKSREEYRTLMENVPIGVMSVDNNFCITAWNGTAQALTGINPEECLGKLCLEVLQCDELNICPLQDAMENQSMSGPIERHIKTKNGTIIPVRCMGAPFFDQAGKIIGAIKTIQDISELRSLEKERDLTISMLAHDMKSPLISIQGFATRLLKRLSPSRIEPIDDYLKIILNEAEKLEKLIKEFLDFSRLRSGKFLLALSETDLKSEIIQIIDALIPQFSQEGIKVELNFEDNFPTVSVDSEKIRRVFNNVIENALKHSPAKSTINISAEATNTDILIKITDQGFGISSEDIPYIFEPFYQGTNRKRRRGYGLGLAAVSSIVKAHGGKVYVSSEVGQGSCFTIALPYKNSLPI